MILPATIQKSIMGSSLWKEGGAYISENGMLDILK
jgi:hypothetical protein